jgi:hypothetical protein
LITGCMLSAVSGLVAVEAAGLVSENGAMIAKCWRSVVN